MMQAVEASLKRLKTDYIDLYWVHIWDQITPVEEVVRGLDDLVPAGKVSTQPRTTRQRHRAESWPSGNSVGDLKVARRIRSYGDRLDFKRG
jgi:hypothetical protein